MEITAKMCRPILRASVEEKFSIEKRNNIQKARRSLCCPDERRCAPARVIFYSYLEHLVLVFSARRAVLVLKYLHYMHFVLLSRCDVSFDVVHLHQLLTLSFFSTAKTRHTCAQRINGIARMQTKQLHHCMFWHRHLKKAIIIVVFAYFRWLCGRENSFSVALNSQMRHESVIWSRLEKDLCVQLAVQKPVLKWEERVLCEKYRENEQKKPRGIMYVI